MMKRTASKMFNFMKKGKIEYLIVGLGNPAAHMKKHATTQAFRHLTNLPKTRALSLKR